MATQVQPVQGVSVWMTDHPPSDADFDQIPPDGTLAVDVENQKLWARCRGNWVGVGLA